MFDNKYLNAAYRNNKLYCSKIPLGERIPLKSFTAREIRESKGLSLIMKTVYGGLKEKKAIKKVLLEAVRELGDEPKLEGYTIKVKTESADASKVATDFANVNAISITAEVNNETKAVWLAIKLDFDEELDTPTETEIE